MSSGSETHDVALSTDDDEKAISKTKAKGKAITRRMSFSTTRPWSSYAENYSSCLSSLRRNSGSKAQSPRQGSIQSSSFESLSRSLDSQQLRNLKTTETSTSEEKQRPFKVSPLHARPFHQRRWSSPVVFPIANSAAVTSSAPPTSQNLNNEASSNSDISGNISDKMQNDKISEIEEITLQSYFHEPSAVLQAPSDITIIKDEEKDTDKQESVSPMSNTKEMIESPSNAKGFVDESQTNCFKEAEKDAILSKNHENVMDNIGDKKSVVTICKINSPTIIEITASAKIDENFQKGNIYTEIKKNTKWTSSKNFRRRRHHTIHTDTRNFLPRNLSTIVEQSSISLDARDKAQNCSKETNGGGKLQHRRSRSLEDIKTLSEDAENRGVFVQQLYSKSLSVAVGAGNTRSDGQNSPNVSTVKYNSGEESGRNSINGTVQVNQVNVQTLSFAERSNDVRPQYRAVVCAKQSLKRPQHAVFTQAKPKWASITIPQI